MKTETDATAETSCTSNIPQTIVDTQYNIGIMNQPWLQANYFNTGVDASPETSYTSNTPQTVDNAPYNIGVIINHCYTFMESKVRTLVRSTLLSHKVESCLVRIFILVPHEISPFAMRSINCSLTHHFAGQRLSS
jgi:hypothetical protein